MPNQADRSAGADDPFVVLGLDPGASDDEIRARRRLLAKQAHPDLGGDAATMRRINVAAEAALGARRAETDSSPRPDGAASRCESGAGTAGRGADTEAPTRPARGAGRVVSDIPSFTIEALPAEAFEALLVVASWLGEVVSDDPPYLLDAVLDDVGGPGRSTWCRVELWPDAGSSTVGLTVGSIEGGPPPSVDAVRDAWIGALNGLDWDRLDRADPQP